jgi:hypothetical protein
MREQRGNSCRAILFVSLLVLGCCASSASAYAVPLHGECMPYLLQLGKAAATLTHPAVLSGTSLREVGICSKLHAAHVCRDRSTCTPM